MVVVENKKGPGGGGGWETAVTEEHTVSFAVSRQTWGYYRGKGGGKVESGRGKRPFSNTNRDVLAQANACVIRLREKLNTLRAAGL